MQEVMQEVPFAVIKINVNPEKGPDQPLETKRRMQYTAKD